MYESWYGEPPPRTVRAFAFVEGGRILGIAGLIPANGFMMLFSDLSEEARRGARELLRTGRKLLAHAGARGLPVYATPAPEVEAAPRFLERLGFRQVSEGGIYEWRG